MLPEDVHTLVLWSKDFRPVLQDTGGVRQALARYEQVFCHLTVTGLGGTALEPNIAPWNEVISQLPALTEFAGHPRRVSVRYDPIVHWYEGDQIQSNLALAEPISRQVMSSSRNDSAIASSPHQPEELPVALAATRPGFHF